jgi:CrcB protein
MSYIIVGIGGLFGAMVRYGLMSVFNTTSFAYGTLVANGLGSLLAGVFFVIISQKLHLSEAYRLALIVGFCGSLTTLSTISLDSIQLFYNGEYTTSIINMIINICISIVLVVVGIGIAKLVG